jgi:hypothetical protein
VRRLNFTPLMKRGGSGTSPGRAGRAAVLVVVQVRTEGKEKSSPGIHGERWARPACG